MKEAKLSKLKVITRDEDFQYLAPQIAIAVIAALAFIVTHFFLNGWAEASAANHNIEHIIIFLSGSAFGSALFSILQSKR